MKHLLKLPPLLALFYTTVQSALIPLKDADLDYDLARLNWESLFNFILKDDHYVGYSVGADPKAVYYKGHACFSYDIKAKGEHLGFRMWAIC